MMVTNTIRTLPSPESGLIPMTPAGPLPRASRPRVPLQVLMAFQEVLQTECLLTHERTTLKLVHLAT